MPRQPPRFPGYDVLSRRDTLSWDGITRKVVDARLNVSETPRFLSRSEWETADALCRRIVPQDGEADAVLLVALLDAKLHDDHDGGFRKDDMPYMRDAWKVALAALDAESKARHDGRHFAALDDAFKDALITMMQNGEFHDASWHGMDPKTFFHRRLLVDVPPLYYSHPKSWNEIGFGGPASPRGYVRLEGHRRDPWEAAEATSGDPSRALRLNRHVV